MLNSTSGAQNAIANVSRTPGSPVRMPTRAQQRVIRAGAHGDEHGASHWHARRCAGERVSVGREVACLGLRRVSPSLSHHGWGETSCSWRSAGRSLRTGSSPMRTGRSDTPALLITATGQRLDATSSSGHSPGLPAAVSRYRPGPGSHPPRLLTCATVLAVRTMLDGWLLGRATTSGHAGTAVHLSRACRSWCGGCGERGLGRCEHADATMWTHL